MTAYDDWLAEHGLVDIHKHLPGGHDQASHGRRGGQSGKGERRAASLAEAKASYERASARITPERKAKGEAKIAAMRERAQAKAKDRAPTVPEPSRDRITAEATVRNGSGYGGSDYEVGSIIRVKERDGSSKIGVVAEAGRRYYREDGLSFGVGDESGYAYWAKVVPPTDDEVEARVTYDRARAARKAIGDRARAAARSFASGGGQIIHDAKKSDLEHLGKATETVSLATRPSPLEELSLHGDKILHWHGGFYDDYRTTATIHDATPKRLADFKMLSTVFQGGRLTLPAPPDRPRSDRFKDQPAKTKSSTGTKSKASSSTSAGTKGNAGTKPKAALPVPDLSAAGRLHADGDTYSHRHVLRAVGFKWDRDTARWTHHSPTSLTASDKEMLGRSAGLRWSTDPIIRRAVNPIPDLKGVKRLHASGNTRAHKDALRLAGFKWDPDGLRWTHSSPNRAASQEKIAALAGKDGLKWETER